MTHGYNRRAPYLGATSLPTWTDHWCCEQSSEASGAAPGEQRGNLSPDAQTGQWALAREVASRAVS